MLLAVPLCRRPNLAGSLIATGTLIFSGSLYAMVLTDQRKLGAITVRSRCSLADSCFQRIQFLTGGLSDRQPIGGFSMVAGWLALLL